MLYSIVERSARRSASGHTGVVLALRRSLAIALLLVAAVAILRDPGSRWWRAGRLLLNLSAAMAGEPAPASTAHSTPLTETNLWIPGRARPIRTRLYQSATPHVGRGVVVAHGVHYQGIEERRLVVFARALARSGLTVLTPLLEDLADYHVTQDGIDVISDSARYLSTRDDLQQHPRVGVIGFSLAGGLALVAAAAPDASQHMAYVASVGGHHDLARTLQFLISNQVRTPSGTRPLQAHEYGLVVAVYEHLEQFAPPEDRAVLRAAFRAWLQEDRDGARVLASQRTTAEGEDLFQLLESQRLATLRPTLEEILDVEQDRLAALSPRGRLGEIQVPVYLLHGAGDTVIPPSEARWASLELGAARHEILVTPLIQHVAVSGAPAWQDELALVQFMTRIL